MGSSINAEYMGIYKKNSCLEMKIFFVIVFLAVCIKSVPVSKNFNHLEKAVSNTLADYEALDGISSLHSPHDSIAWKDQNRKAEMAKEINMELMKVCMELEDKSGCFQTVFDADYFW